MAQGRVGPPAAQTTGQDGTAALGHRVGQGWAVGSGGNPACVPSAGTVCGRTPEGQSKTQLLPREPAVRGAHPVGAVNPMGTEPTVRGRPALKSQGTRQCPRKTTSFRKAGRGGSGLGAFAGKGIWLWVVVPRAVLRRKAHPLPISSTAPSAPPGASEL